MNKAELTNDENKEIRLGYSPFSKLIRTGVRIGFRSWTIEGGQRE